MQVRIIRLFLLGAVLYLAGCAQRLDFPALAEPQRGEERRILVTFVDHSIGREVPANGLDRYRLRGPYAPSGWSSNRGKVLAEQYGLRLLAEWPVTALGVACVVYEVPSSLTMEGVLKILREDQRVESVQPMHSFRGTVDALSDASTYNDPYYRLQRDMQAMRIEAAQRLATGRGIRVAVIDSGVDAAHPDLAAQIARSENLALIGRDQDAAEVHGTAVAGVIAARARNGRGIVGIAPAARLYALRACWSEHRGAVTAACNSFTLALAVNEAIRLKVQIINLSLTGPDDALVGRLIYAALEQGILVVAADPGERGAANGFPADVDRVIAVRSDAPQPDAGSRTATGLSAPGTAILTTLPHDTYDFMSGSSFAAPHITGLLALMLEVKPGLGREEALQALRGTSPAARLMVSAIDACQVLARLRGIPACDEMVAEP